MTIPKRSGGFVHHKTDDGRQPTCSRGRSLYSSAPQVAACGKPGVVKRQTLAFVNECNLTVIAPGLWRAGAAIPRSISCWRLTSGRKHFGRFRTASGARALTPPGMTIGTVARQRTAQFRRGSAEQLLHRSGGRP
jgi:hypothetical protein